VNHEYESSLGVTIKYNSTPDDLEITHVMAGSMNVFWFLPEEERARMHKELEERLKNEKKERRDVAWDWHW